MFHKNKSKFVFIKHMFSFFIWIFLTNDYGLDYKLYIYTFTNWKNNSLKSLFIKIVTFYGSAEIKSLAYIFLKQFNMSDSEYVNQ